MAILSTILDWLDGIQTTEVITWEGPLDLQSKKRCATCGRNLTKIESAREGDLRREVSNHHLHMLAEHGA